MKAVLMFGGLKQYIAVKQPIPSRLKISIGEPLSSMELIHNPEATVTMKILEFEFTGKWEACPICGEMLPIYEVVSNE